MESDSFIFDDDIEEIGSDVEAFCPKCKADTAHTIITKYEDEIRRVQCSPCGDVHAYRKPRGELEEEGAVPVDEKNKKKVVKKPTWEEFFQKHDPSLCRPYSFRDTYIENDIVTHPKFGMGFASETYDEDKVEITFKDQRRVLVHNRKELPGAPPELARAPKPRPLPKPIPKSKKGKALAVAAGEPPLSRIELAAQRKAAKEAARLQKEQERAAKQAKLEAERAAKKAKLEAERAAKQAKLEAARAAKQAKLEKLRAAKQAKLEKLRAAKAAKLEKLRAARLAQFEKIRQQKLAIKAKLEKLRLKKAAAVAKAAAQKAAKSKSKVRPKAAKKAAKKATKKAKKQAKKKK